ncbi:hypothetical protein [Williamsia phyllosphaerae]|uniref:Uncharacterized protein n=1 Tax=Williamsia phyllosphaerae TaxID=885042 RepID=A0ABQ1UFT5_9NOCA|nr:hypothetical protein [Williamsia phyllosphaerae]GGF16976.1 hypothetical protein GCM10007298_11240 [Williamsia phyllosphaerae]
MTTSPLNNPSRHTDLRPERTAHEHGWSTESAHPTSEGTVRYVRCNSCGARRVDLQFTSDDPPRGLSRSMRSRGTG